MKRLLHVENNSNDTPLVYIDRHGAYSVYFLEQPIYGGLDGESTQAAFMSQSSGY